LLSVAAIGIQGPFYMKYLPTSDKPDSMPLKRITIERKINCIKEKKDES
jgi:predicted small lipoprotein YifL